MLTTSARWLALLRAASAGFAAADALRQAPAREPAGVVCLNDVAPYDMVFDAAGHLAGWIDVDLAFPGPAPGTWRTWPTA